VEAAAMALHSDLSLLQPLALALALALLVLVAS